MWLDDDWRDRLHERREHEWPTWHLVEPEGGEPCLYARYDDGTEVGPYRVVLPQ